MSLNKKNSYKSAIDYLFQFIKPHISLYLIPSIIALVLVGTGIMYARNTQILIDGSIAGDKVLVVSSLIVFLIITFITIILNYISGKCTTKLAAKASKDLKEHISEILLHAKYGSILKLRSGDVLSTINSDTQVVSDFIAGDLVGLFSQLVLAIGVIIYLFFINPLLAMVTLAYTPIGMFLTIFINSKMNRLFPINADYRGEALSIIEQVLMQIPVIKSFLLEKHIKERIYSKYKAIFKNQMKITFWNALMQTACSTTSQIPRLMYLMFAGYMVMRGSITVGVFIAVFDLLNYFIGPTVYFPFMLNGLNKSIASINRIKRLEDIPQQLFVGLQKEQKIPEIYIDNISFRYSEDKTVINKFEFNYKGNEIVGICGESGSGKTTLLDLIAGLYMPKTGCVKVNSKSSFVTQDPFLFRQTVFENIHLVRKDASDQEVHTAIKLANAENFVKQLPLGTNTLLGDGNTRLSGGEKQRISLARAILADYPILILDEPTSALDNETEKAILEVIMKMSKTKLILIAAHRISLKKIADVIINLDKDNNIIEESRNESV